MYINKMSQMLVIGRDFEILYSRVIIKDILYIYTY